MKKIILAVASVLALGLFASCQREISGDLNVTETTTTFKATDWLNDYSKFDVTGTLVKTVKTTTKVGTADATWTETVTTDTPHGDWERKIGRNRVSGGDNRTWINFYGKYNERRVTSQSGTTATTTVIEEKESYYRNDQNQNEWLTIEKNNGVYYINGLKADVQPEGDTATVSCTLTESKTETSGNGPSSTLVETVTTTDTKYVYTLKFTKR